MECADLIFEWDEEKNLLNQRKHGISFETASYVFEDENYIEMYDFEHSIDEDRYIAIGCVGDVLFVVFTERKYQIDFRQIGNGSRKELVL